MLRSARRLALPELPVEDFVGAARRAGRHRRRLGAGRARAEPLPAAVHVRLRGVPRRAPGRTRCASCVHRLAGRRRTSPAASSRCRSGSRPRLHPRGRRAAWVRPSAAATTRPAWRPAGGRRARLRPGGVPRRCRAPLGRGARRHERVLRLRATAGSSRPELTGTILEGVTRDSILTLAAEPAERRASAGSASTSGATASPSGEITEVFACGTAAVITPVGRLGGTAASVAGPATATAGDRIDRRRIRSARCSTSSTAAPRTPTAGCAAWSDGDSTRDVRLRDHSPNSHVGEPARRRREARGRLA